MCGRREKGECKGGRGRIIWEGKGDRGMRGRRERESRIGDGGRERTERRMV